jgi:hypothetical protein
MNTALWVQTAERRGVPRLVAANLVIAAVYWGVSWLNWFLFRSGGVLPMPIWPAAGPAESSTSGR